VRVTSLFLIFFLLISPVPASASAVNSGPIDPSQWPNSRNIEPHVEGWPNAVRFWGPDRYQTGLSVALSLRGSGSFPFGTPDPSSSGAANLADANGWWGASTCPRSVLIVAGDTPADALSAASLSDPTGQSTEPYLRRSSSADPLFDPIGGFSRVDTYAAPILVTASARGGAKELSPATKVAVQDLRNGGCRTVRQAVIVGGPRAVPLEVDTELISLGVNEVFRVFGDNRYSTAVNVAISLGTKPIPNGTEKCLDSSAMDGNARMKFYANSVVEWRASASECELLGETIVLTDGETGADALAAGWWTSFWQVPMLLHNGSSSLPQETLVALESMEISNVIVLGGTARVSERIVDNVAEITGATMRRVAGGDRYQTSIAMAQHFGGWWETGRGDEFSSSLICLAASSGSGKNSRGWADALSAGAWCGNASGAAANPGAPQRALGPVRGSNPALVSIPNRPGHDAVPVILIPTRSTRLPGNVEDFLAGVFEPADSWCSSVSSVAGCAAPGFAVIFGGESVIPSVIGAGVSSLVSGGTVSRGSDSEVKLNDIFVTELEMSPVYHQWAGPGGLKACVPRGSYKNARWLVAGLQHSQTVIASADVMLARWYLQDRDGRARKVSEGAPGCINFEAGATPSAWFKSVGIDGRSSSAVTYDVDMSRRVSVMNDIFSDAPVGSTGVDTVNDSSLGGESVLVFLSDIPRVGIASQGLVTVINSAGIIVTLNRGIDGYLAAPDTFTASWNLATAQGTLVGNARGEALLRDGLWELRGKSQLLGGTMAVADGVGGFTATLNPGLAGMGDDTITWMVDSIGTQ
jgi:putative cell wall-binding protein